MLCKKCGAEITDNAKFCGYCGETVETAPIVNEPQNVETTINAMSSEPAINEVDLGKTVVVEPITPEMGNSASEPVTDQNIATQLEPSAQKNKGKVPVLAIVGIILAVVAIVLLVFAFANKSSNSVEVLKKSLANFENGYDSATIRAKLSASASGTSLDFSATVRTQKIDEKKANIHITVDPSLLFEEMNIYATTDEKEANLYLESTLIDMLGATSSLTPSWVKYSLKLDEMIEEANLEDKLNDLKLEDVIDEKHFVYVDKVDKLNHYQLIIDQELINKLEELSGEEIEETQQLEKDIKIDFYISKSNEISKIELDMSEYLKEDDTISSLVMSLEIKDLNKTQIQIPSEALNTTTDLETYIANNSVSFGGDYDYNSDLDSDYDYDYDYDLDYDNSSYDSNYDFDWEY